MTTDNQLITEANEFAENNPFYLDTDSSKDYRIVEQELNNAFIAGANWQKEQSFDLMRWANLNNYTISSEGWIQDTNSIPISDDELYNIWLKNKKH